MSLIELARELVTDEPDGGPMLADLRRVAKLHAASRAVMAERIKADALEVLVELATDDSPVDADEWRARETRRRACVDLLRAGSERFGVLNEWFGPRPRPTDPRDSKSRRDGPHEDHGIEPASEATVLELLELLGREDTELDNNWTPPNNPAASDPLSPGERVEGPDVAAASPGRERRAEKEKGEALSPYPSPRRISDSPRGRGDSDSSDKAPSPNPSPPASRRGGQAQGGLRISDSPRGRGDGDSSGLPGADAIASAAELDLPDARSSRPQGAVEDGHPP